MTSTNVAEETVRVEVVEQGSKYLVHLDNVSLNFESHGREVLVRDTDLAQWLGYKQPRMIRKLLKRMLLDGKLPEAHVRSTVERTLMPHGGSRETVIDEYWLNRTQALLVATQSQTPRAWELTTLMVKVFEAVLDGAYPRPANDNDAVLERIAHALVKLTEGQQKLTDRLLELENRVKGGVQTQVSLGRDGARKILDRIKTLAERYEPKGTKPWSKKRSKLEHIARKRCGVAMGRRWEDAPAHIALEAKICLDELEIEAKRVQARQTNIPGTVN